MDDIKLDDEPTFRCRIKIFADFVRIVQDIRCSISFYRIFDTLYTQTDEMKSGAKQLTPFDIQSNNIRFLGFANVGMLRQKRWHCAFNGFIYQYKLNVKC